MFRTDLPQHVGALLARLQTNPYNAFVTVSRDLPEQSARIAECQQAHTAGTLAGITVAVKDNICLEGYPVTCASHSLETFVAPYDATVVTRLRQADALLIGKTNLTNLPWALRLNIPPLAQCKIRGRLTGYRVVPAVAPRRQSPEIWLMSP